MIEVLPGVNLPQHWHELTPSDAIKAVELLELYMAGSISIWDVKVLLFTHIVDYVGDDKRYTPEEIETITCNVAMIAEQLNFLTIPHYEDEELLAVLSPDLQAELRRKFPNEIYRADWLGELDMIRSMLRYSARINLHMRKNIIPSIDTDKGVMTGPVFDIDDFGIVTTDMITAEYVDAYDYFNLYGNTRRMEYLNAFVAVLYRPDRMQRYSTFEAQQRAAIFDNVPLATKKAAFIWFQSLLEYFYERSPFAMLFQKKPDNSGFSLGMGNTIYALAAKGYGSKKEVDQFLVSDYFAIQLREIVEAVRSMKAYNAPISDIEKETGLLTEVIQKIK